MQNINLYRFLPRPVKSTLTYNTLLFCYAIFFILLMGKFFLDLTHKHQVTVALIQSNAELASLQSQVSTLSDQYAKNNSVVAMAQDTTDLPCHAKFSSYLQTIAEAIISGVWLTNINILANGKQVTLSGYAVKAPDVQQFLAKLNQQALFAALNFEIEQLNEPEQADTIDQAAKNYLSFTLVSKG